MTVLKKAMIAFLFLAVVTVLATAEDTPSVTITYISNEGFLIASGDKRVLIDALFDTSFGQYSVPSDSLVKNMARHASPFESIDLFLITHSHRDHFYAPYVVDFLKTHPETQLVGSVAVCNQAREVDKAAKQIREIDLAVGASTEKTFAQIPLKIYRTKHSRDVEGTREENLTYLINLNNVKLLHLGDGPIAFNLSLFKDFALEKENIDVVFLSYFDLADATRRYVQEVIRPKYVVAMHAPPKGAESELRTFRDSYPDGIIFEKPMESKVLKLGKNGRGPRP